MVSQVVFYGIYVQVLPSLAVISRGTLLPGRLFVVGRTARGFANAGLTFEAIFFPPWRSK
jgi:hypothetical protein